MSNLLTLTKVDFMSSFGIGNKKKDRASKSFKTIILLVSIFGLLFSTLYNVIFCLNFKLANAPMYYGHVLFIGIAALLTLSTSVTKVKSIFMGKDYEMLSAMPVTKREIIASKLVSLYLVELFYSAIVLLPNIVVITVITQDLRYILTGVLSMFLCSGIPLVLAVLLAMFIALIADRYKFGNIISIILYVIFFAGVFFVSYLGNSGSKVDADGNIDPTGYILLSKVMSYINPTTLFIEFSYAKSFLFVLLYIPANLIMVVGVICFISLFYDKIHELTTQQKNNAVYVQKDLAVVPQGKTLFQHELKRLCTSRFYFINSMSSGIVAVLMAAFMGYMFGPWSTMIPDPTVAEFLKTYGYIGFLVIAFGIGIATPASVSISIEGKNFWIIKAYPVDYKALLRAKIWVSTLTLWICGFLASIVLCICLQTMWYNYFFVTALTMIYVALTSICGLRINLKRYKLDWKNEQECCKNSAAVVLAMLLDWGIMCMITTPLIGLSFIPVVGQYVAATVVILGMLLATVLLYKNTIRTAEKRIERIVC